MPRVNLNFLQIEVNLGNYKFSAQKQLKLRWLILGVLDSNIFRQTTFPELASFIDPFCRLHVISLRNLFFRILAFNIYLLLRTVLEYVFHSNTYHIHSPWFFIYSPGLNLHFIEYDNITTYFSICLFWMDSSLCKAANPKPNTRLNVNYECISWLFAVKMRPRFLGNTNHFTFCFFCSLLDFKVFLSCYKFGFGLN